jgi:hypothetical protein
LADGRITKMIKLLLSVVGLAAVIILGCVTSNIRFTQDEIKEYPVDMQQHIIKGEVVPGMTPVQVRYAWGAPDEVKVSTTPEGKPQEEWLYKSAVGIFKTRLTFIEGKLTTIISSEPRKIQ